MPFFEIPITVTPADVDDQGHVNNVIYVRWMQDAAAAHWQAAAGAELRATVFWVVTHHEVEYKAPAFDGERLLARTWVGEARGATWERFIEIRRAADRSEERRVGKEGRSRWSP